MANPTRLLLTGMLIVAFGAAARADVPQELTGSWDPCRYNFGTHTHSTVREWALDRIRFDVNDELLGDEEYYFDVAQSLTNKLQDMTLHIVRGKDGAIPQPQIDPATVCDSDALALQPAQGDFTYMVGFAELAGEPGEPLTPHLVFFVPMRIKEDLSRRHFALGVLHLSSEGASATAPAALSADASLALHTGDEGALRPSIVSILLQIMNHNGIVHGSD